MIAKFVERTGTQPAAARIDDEKRERVRPSRRRGPRRKQEIIRNCSIRDVHLAAGKDPVLPVAAGARAYAHDVAAGIGFGQRECAYALGAHAWQEILALLRLAPQGEQ